MLKSRKSPCSVNYIHNRELFNKNHELRGANWDTLNCIIRSNKSASLPLIKGFETDKPCSKILYDEGFIVVKHLNSNKFLQIYNLNGLNGKPLLRHKNLPLLGEWKDRAFGIISLLPPKDISVISSAGSCFKTAFYYITNKSLHCIDLKNGYEIVAIILPQLPEGFRYAELSMDDEKHLLAISSTKKTEKNSDVLMFFTLYQYFPNLIFQRVLEIRKSIFGDSICGAEINQGILLTLHKKEEIKAYSLSSICNQQATPPLLLSVISYNHMLNIGSFPYYGIKADSYKIFRVFELEENKLVRGGLIEARDDSFDSSISFHPDGSPRLIFIDSNGSFRNFYITKACDDSQSSITSGPTFSLSTSGLSGGMSSPAVMKTASGRTVRRPPGATFIADEDENVITAWDYEDDLKIVGIVYAQVFSGRHPLVELTLDLIDSLTSHLIKRIKLGDKFKIGSNESMEISLRLDADICLVSIARNSRSTINFFRLTYSKE